MASQSNERVFFVSSIVVSGGNYLFNVLMAKWLLPEVFSDVAFLVTLLLGVSFLAMSYQLTATKLIVQRDHSQITNLATLSVYTGLAFSLLFFLGAGFLSRVFQFSDVLSLRVYALVFLAYFVMSVNRGLWQGQEAYSPLSFSYQVEMLSRLLFSIVAIRVLDLPPVLSVSVAIVISVLLAMLPWHRAMHLGIGRPVSVRPFVVFFYSTLIYELSLVLINNTDIFLVKSFFSPADSGMYASIALVGRMIYFFSWMWVMVFIPKMIESREDVVRRQQLLAKAMAVVFGFGFVACVVSYVFADDLVGLVFGERYLPVSHLLWKYSIATSLFSCANIFSYYFLTQEIYKPIYATLIAAVLQIAIISAYHPDLTTVVWIQVALMLILLLWQVAFYFQRADSQIAGV